jgi:outer membrane receptor protein involved in Fe transport
MEAYDVAPERVEYFRISRRDRMWGAFLLHEKQFGNWRLDLGLRGDTSIYRTSFVSPRAALIFQPSPAWTYKFLYGRSFRNPSAFELFFDDGLTAEGNPDARPERADTIEIDADRTLGRRWKLTTAAYAYQVKDFLVPAPTESGVFQYQNIGKISAAGGEAELNGRPFDWLEVVGSYAVQKSTDHDEDGALENSARHLGKLRLALPAGRRVQVSTSMQYLSSRRSLGGFWTRPVYLADFTLASRGLLPNFDVRMGLRNAFNRRYSDPIALNPRVDVMPQTGRTFFVEFVAHGRE